MSDKRSKTSAENGKKGGRPIAEATLLAQIARDRIAKRLDKELEPILNMAIRQAKKGNRHARQWLSDQAWGKAPQPLTGPDGGAIQIEGVEIKVRR